MIVPHTPRKYFAAYVAQSQAYLRIKKLPTLTPMEAPAIFVFGHIEKTTLGGFVLSFRSDRKV